MANDLKEYWTRRMAEQGRAVDGTPLPTQTPQTTQTPQAATTPQADTTPASNNPLYNYWSRRMAEQGKAIDGSPLTSNLTTAPGAETNTTPSDISTIRNWYTGVNTDLTTINNYASSGDYDAKLNQEYLAKLRNYNTELDGYIESASSQGYNKDANTMQNTKNGVDALIQQLESSANKQTKGMDTSIQKTLGSASEYSQQISDLESQIKELERTNHRGVIRQDTDAVSGELYDVYGNVNDEALHQLREQLQNTNANKAAAERAERRERLRSNPNFKQYSSSITPLAENDTAIRALGGKSIDAVSGETVTDQSVKDLLGYATKDEEQMFNYILARQGEDAAAEYLDDLRYDLNARQASEKSQEASRYAGEHEVLASGKSVGQNLISGAGLLDTAIQNIYRDATGNNRRIDYNTWANQQSQQVQAARGTVAQELTDKYGTKRILGKDVSWGDAYQLGMSMLDSGATAALGGVTGLGSGTAALIGASAGTQAMQEAVKEGASDSQALTLGFAAMAAETITEKVSLENLLKSPGKNILMNALRQAGIEASEEAASTVLNELANETVMDEDSDFNKRVREYEANGMSHEEAQQQAWKQFGSQLLWDAIGGAISGGIMGGMAKSINGDTNTDTNTQQETRAPDNELLNTLSQYDNAQIQAINKSNQENAILRAMDEYDQRNAADVERNRNILSRLADYDASNIAAMKATEQINAKRAEAAQQRADAQNAEIRARNEQRRQTQALNNSKYQVADTYNYQLSPEEQMSLQYDSKSKFREALVSQSNGEISYKEAGEIFDSARNKGNRGNERVRLSEEAEALAWEATSPTQFIKQNKAFLRQNGIDYADARKIWQNVRNRAEYENAVQQNPALAEELEPEVEPSYTPIRVRGADLSMPFSEIMRSTAAQNSPTEQTSVSETNNVSTEPTPSATESQQTASAPRVTENTTNTAENTAQAEPQQTRAKPTSSTNIRYRLNPRTNAEAVTKYGILEEGEIPARESYVPAQTADNTRVSRAARTVAEAEAIPEESLGSVYQAVEDGKFDYVPITLEDVANKARAKIRREGFDATLRNWTAEVRAGKSNEDLIAEGAILLNNIANYDLGGKLYIDTLTDYITVTHNTAEALAATRLLKRLSPEGKLYGLQKTVDKYNEQLGENGNIKINEELADRFLKEKTDKGRDKIITELQQDIADQIPTNFRDAFTALRYVNMLGNFKTQGRNLLGNTIMMAAAKTKRSHQAVMTAVYNALGGKAEKNTSLFVDKALKKEALADYAEHQSEALGEKKYADVARQNDAELQDKRTIFKWNWKGEAKTGAEQKLRNLADLPMKGLEAYRRATNWAMEQGDVIFSRATYADAMAGYLQAHGVKSFADASEEMLDNARNYAIKEAQEATFRDSNKVSDWAAHFDSNWGKAKVITQGIVPFRKTPANVGVRAVEYSPANALIQAGKAVYNLAKGNPQASSADVINALSKTMTGTELFALGVTGALAGWARGRNDDEDEGYYEKMNGAQDYAVKLPFGEKGYWISLSQLAPMSIPFFMGSEFVEAMQDGGLRGDNIMNILGAVSAPMLEMSMLSGVNDALNNLTKYNGDKALIPQFVLNSAMGYLTQAFSNTLLGQAEQVSEEYRQQSYTDSESALPTGIQKVIGRIAAKTPGWDYQQGDYINAWGEKQSNGGVGERAFNAFLNPTYGAEDTTDELDKALYELNDELRELGNETNIFPDTVSRGVDIDGTKLTESEYERYATERGQLSHDLVEEFTSSPYWKELSAEEKADTIRDLYSYARDRAEQNIRASRGTIEVGKSGDDNLAANLDNNPEDIAGYLALNKAFSQRAKVNDYAGIDSLLSTVNTHKNEDGTYSDPEVQQMTSDKEFSRYLTAYAGGTKSELVGNVIENIAAANSLLPDEDSAAAGPKIRIAFETLARNGADAQDFKNVLESYKKEGISQANLNWLVKNYFPDDPETQAELFNIFRDYQQTNGKWKTPFEKVTKSTEPENLMP